MSSNSRPQTQPEDKVLDITLRPSRWDEYIGQERTKEKLRIFIDAAKNRHDALDHVLLYGPPGLGKTIEEMLYPAMEQRSLDIILGKGPGARTIQLELPPFTLVAATTRIGLISSPLRSRFGITARLDFYSEEDLKRIL